MRRLIAAIAFCALSVPGVGQTVSGDRFTLNTGPCVERSGSGAPNGSVTGNVCDVWHDTSTGLLWSKVSGTGNTGWISWGSANVASMLVSRDAAGAFSMGALSATTGLFSASATTPALFGNGTGSALNLGGTGIAGCTTNPPSTANCEAGIATFASAMLEQQLATDPTYRTQWFVGTGGAQLNAYRSSAGWLPLTLNGAPVLLTGGGLRMGQAVGTSDPGAGNAYWDGWIQSSSPPYVSMTTGMDVDFSTGSIDAQYITANEMKVKSFIADLEQALAGGQIIAKSVAQVGAVFTVPAGGSISTLTVKDLPSATGMAMFESGDYIRIREFSRAGGGLSITDAWGNVTNHADLGNGLQTWTFTRLVTNGGAMSTGVQIAVDAIVLDYGLPGNGFYEVNAIDGAYGVNSPYAQVVTWTGNSPIAANQTLRARFGNLKGVTGTAEYGLIAGTYAATNGQYFIASDQHFELHGIDLSLWNGSTRTMYLNHLTPYWSMGNPAPTSYSSGLGCWSGIDAGVYKWRCGDPSGTNLIAWNGSTLSVVGAITISGTVTDANNALNLVGTAGATVVSGAALGALGIDANGNPLLPHAASPSGSGLFLGSDHLGYFASGDWKTYMDNSGGFYLGGVAGALQWNGSALTISGTLTGDGSGVTSINGGHITAGTVTTTQLSFTPATSTNVVASINASGEGIQISGARIAISGSTTFSSGYDPTGKIATSGAAEDVNTYVTTISGGKITAGTITADRVAAHTLTGWEIAAHTIDAGNITAHTITAGEIAAGTITATQIAAGTITADRVTAHTLTGYEIAGSTIEAWNIASHTITADQIAASTITADRLNVSSLAAISANIGTITSGSLNINSGSFQVTGAGVLTAYGPSFYSVVLPQFTGHGKMALCVENDGTISATTGSCT